MSTENKLWKIGNKFSKIGLVGLIVGPCGLFLTFLIDIAVNDKMDWEYSLPFFILSGVFYFLEVCIYRYYC